jgi:uncharacterized protein YjbJ (UPF0337 family)
MNKDELKGKAENLKGRIKEAFGSLSGDKRAEAEGAAERAKGAVHEKVGQAEEAVDDAVKDESEERREAAPKIPEDLPETED